MKVCETPGCRRPHYAKGWCQPCYKQIRRKGFATAPKSPDERFDEKWRLDPETGCHVWNGARIETGHGVFWLNGKNIGAHVYAFIRKHGSVPAGKHLDHFKCDNPPCCNPDHVKPVTPYENWARGQSPMAENLRKTHCPAGHPYDEANTQIIEKTGHRHCRECKRIKAYEKYVQDNPSSIRRGQYRTKRSTRAL